MVCLGRVGNGDNYWVWLLTKQILFRNASAKQIWLRDEFTICGGWSLNYGESKLGVRSRGIPMCEVMPVIGLF